MMAQTEAKACFICNDQKFVYLFNGDFMLYDIGGRKIDCPHCFRTDKEEGSKLLKDFEDKAKKQLEEVNKAKKPAKPKKKKEKEQGGVFTPIKG
jgi:hypothetical protein